MSDPTPVTEPSRGTICKCGLAKSYHTGPKPLDHEYEPRYPARRAVVPDPTPGPDALPRHGAIEYDDQDEWLTESDPEGASQTVARDVPRWFGRLVVAALSGDAEGGLDAAWKRAEAALPEGTRLRVVGLATGWRADAITPPFEAGAFVRSPHDTPAAALLALAERLSR